MPYTITNTTPNAIRCHLAAMEQEARRQGCHLDWSLDDIADGSFNSDIYPPGRHYFSFDLTARGHGFHAGYCCIVAENELTKTLAYTRNTLDDYSRHVAAMRRNNQPLQATFNF